MLEGEVVVVVVVVVVVDGLRKPRPRMAERLWVVIFSQSIAERFGSLCVCVWPRDNLSSLGVTKSFFRICGFLYVACGMDSILKWSLNYVEVCFVEDSACLGWL